MAKKLSFFLIIFVFLAGLPGTIFACGGYDPYLEICGPTAISRNIEYVVFPEPESNYAHLFGDQLSPLSFYLLYGKALGVGLKEEDVAKIGNYIKTGYYTESSDEHYYEGQLSVYRGQDSFRLEQQTIENREDVYSQEELGLLKENYNRIPRDGNLYPENEGEGYAVDCGDVKFEPEEIFNPQEETEFSLADRQDNEREPGFFMKIINAIKAFFQRIYSVLFGEKVVEEQKEQEKHGFLAGDAYRIFNHKGSAEYMRDQEYQNAIYYFYRAGFMNNCDYENSKKIFQGIMQDKDSPWHDYAHLGHIRVLARQAALYNNKHTFEARGEKIYRYWFNWENHFNAQPEIEKKYQEVLSLVNGYIGRDDLLSVREDLLFQKQRMLLYFFDEEEFLQAGKDLSSKNPSDFLYSLSVFDGQADLLENLKMKKHLEDFNIGKHPEFTQYLYYWNFADNSAETINKIKQAREGSDQKDLWLVLLLRKAVLAEDYKIERGYIDAALSTGEKNQLYYPLHYYANRIIYQEDSALADKNVFKILDDEKIPTIPYNYFSELVLENSQDVKEAIGYVFKRIDHGISHNGRYPEYKEDCVDCQKEFLISGGLFYYAIEREVPIDMLYRDSMFRNYRQRTMIFNAVRLNRPDIFHVLAREITEKEGDDLMRNATLYGTNDTKTRFMILYAILHSNSCYLASEKTCFSGERETSSPALFEDRLTDQQRNQKRQENLILDDSVIKPLAETIFNYHALNPSDDKIPESLHMLTFYNRYCSRGSSIWPGEVFRFLHRNYPNSGWTKKTPYYY